MWQVTRRSFLSRLAGTLAGVVGGVWVWRKVEAAPAASQRLWVTLNGRMKDGRYKWTAFERPLHKCHERGFAVEINNQDVLSCHLVQLENVNPRNPIGEWQFQYTTCHASPFGSPSSLVITE